MKVPVQRQTTRGPKPKRSKNKRYSGQASPKTAEGTGEGMAQNHYVTKPKRRQKNSNRKDSSAATMAKLRKLAAADAKKSGN